MRGALLTDLIYWQGGWASWAYFSTWLIGAGIVTALLAAIGGFVDFFSEPRIRAIRKAWYHMIGNLIAVVLSVVNFIAHMRDGAASVLPYGIVLSLVVVLLLLFNGWMGGELVFRHGVAVRDPDSTVR